MTTIDPASIKLEGISPLRWDYEDVATPFEGEFCDCHELEGDGYVDLTLKFDPREIFELYGLGSLIDGESMTLAISGFLKEEFGGTEIHGQDCIVILNKR